MASAQQILHEADVRAMVALLSEIAMTSGDLTAKKLALMDGLCALIEVDSWVWIPFPSIREGEAPFSAGFLHGGFDEQRLVAFMEACEHPDMAHFNGLLFREVFERGRPVTRLRQQLDPEDRFSKSDCFPLWQAADISPILLSCYPFQDRSVSLVALYRRADAPLFSERHARMAHIILSEVRWLHAGSLPQAKRIQGQMLSPRQRATTTLLLEGLGRKQIAAHMGISENTVSGYVKEVYRFYEVHSHAELMRHFREGDGGDR